MDTKLLHATYLWCFFALNMFAKICRPKIPLLLKNDSWFRKLFTEFTYFIQVRCRAEIYDIYTKDTERVIRVIKRERQKVLHQNVNFLHNLHEQSSFDKNDISDDAYSTHIQGEFLEKPNRFCFGNFLVEKVPIEIQCS